MTIKELTQIIHTIYEYPSMFTVSDGDNTKTKYFAYINDGHGLYLYPDGMLRNCSYYYPNGYDQTLSNNGAMTADFPSDRHARDAISRWFIDLNIHKIVLSELVELSA